MKLAKVFFSQPLQKHDPASISRKMFDMMNFVKKSHFDSELLEDEQKFYLKYDKENNNETFAESILDNGMIKEREDFIDFMKIVDLNRYPKNQEDAGYRIKRQIKKAVPSSKGLRDCLKSVEEKFPWSSSKFKFMVSLSFFVEVVLSTALFTSDVYTDIRFSLDMYNHAKRDFNAEMIECHSKLNLTVDQVNRDCKSTYNKLACLASAAELKRTSEECFENEQRFTESADWSIVGAVCLAHCVLPILVSLLFWELVQVGKKCNWRQGSIFCRKFARNYCSKTLK